VIPVLDGGRFHPTMVNGVVENAALNSDGYQLEFVEHNADGFGLVGVFFVLCRISEQPGRFRKRDKTLSRCDEIVVARREAMTRCVNTPQTAIKAAITPTTNAPVISMGAVYTSCSRNFKRRVLR
jgi:hypothetical protein